jgi:hypothetical protein
VCGLSFAECRRVKLIVLVLDLVLVLVFSCSTWRDAAVWFSRLRFSEDPQSLLAATAKIEYEDEDEFEDD